MNRSARRTSALASVALLAAALAPLASPAAAQAGTGGEVVLTRPATWIRSVEVAGGDDAGAVAVVGEVSRQRTRTDWVGRDGSSRTLWSGGCTSVGTAPPAGGEAGGTVACRKGALADGYALDVVHLASGSVDHLAVPADETPYAWDGQGWYLRDGSGHLAYRPVGGAPQPLAADLTIDTYAGIAASGTAGALVVAADPTGSSGVYWVPRDGQPARRLADLAPGAQPTLLRASTERLAWSYVPPGGGPGPLQSAAVSDLSAPADQPVPVTSRRLILVPSDGVVIGDALVHWAEPSTLERLPFDPSLPISSWSLPRHVFQTLFTDELAARDGLPLIGQSGVSDHLVTVAADGSTTGRATLPAGVAPARYLALDGGRLVVTYADASPDGGDRMVEYDVAAPARSGGPAPAGTVMADPPYSDTGVGLLSDGWRLVAEHGSGTLRDPLGAVRTLEVSTYQSNVSTDQSFALSGGTVADNVVAQTPDGRLQSFGELNQAEVSASDAFGTRVVWSRVDGSVDYRDLATSPSPVRVLPGVNGCQPCRVPVAAWGDEVVAALPGGGVRLADVRTRAVRVLQPTGSAEVGAVAVDEGLAAWTTGDSIVTLDLTDPSATPQVAVPSGVQWDGHIDLDDGLLAWRGTDDAAHVVPVDPAAHHPAARALRLAVPAAFSPNGDGQQDTWRVALDASRPVSRAVLTIRRGSTVVRTFTADGPDGSVRDLVWDGRTATGAPMPDATYSWTLQATADDGSTVLSTAGRPLAGTVAVARSLPGVALRVPATSAETSTVPGHVVVAWAPTRAPDPGHVLRYDVWSRGAEWYGGRVLYYGWILRVRGTTAGSWTDTRPMEGPGTETRQYLVRVHDDLGNTPVWSALGTTAVATDDGSAVVTRSSGWTWARNGSAYAGADRWTTRRGASTTAYALMGSELFVVGRRCPTCGRMSVRVDGGRWVTVDTYAAASRDRQVLYRLRVTPGPHWVTVEDQATPGRPVLRVDAFAARF